ncbi:MAG: phosphatase PAP2 family protein [Chlorobiaceae bacterium]
MKRSVQWSIAVSAVTLVCSLSFAYGDIPVAAWFHALNDASLFALFSRITLFGDSLSYLVPGLLLYLVFRSSKPHLAETGRFLFVGVAVSGLGADIIKFIAGRARPKLYFSDHIYGFSFFRYEPAWISFPSGHAATAFSAAFVLSALFPRWRILCFALAVLIAFSRIYLSQHYISDVIAGSFLGMASTALLYNRFFKPKDNAIEPSQV